MQTSTWCALGWAVNQSVTLTCASAVVELTLATFETATPGIAACTVDWQTEIRSAIEAPSAWSWIPKTVTEVGAHFASCAYFAR